VRFLTSRPTPNLEDQGIPLWLLPLDLSGTDDPTSSYATAGIPLRVSGALKPHHHDKVETPSMGPFFFYTPHIFGLTSIHQVRLSVQEQKITPSFSKRLTQQPMFLFKATQSPHLNDAFYKPYTLISSFSIEITQYTSKAK
jgi:hypothetical protein